jgi:4-amino-4-deoxy-L-arabinose transferase-like glycosyltransferase
MPNPGGVLFDRLAAPAVFVVALALRLAYLLELSRTPLFSQLLLDPLYYHDWARRIAAGDWLSGGQVFEQSPLYAYILALIYRFCGDGLLAPRIVQAVVGAGSCLVVHLIGRRVFGRRAGLAAGMFMALYAPGIFYDGMIMKESYSLFITAAMTLALVLSGGSRRRLLLLAGLLLGLASLSRDNLILLAPLIALWLVVDLFVRSPLASGRFGEAAVRVACFGAGVAAAILPVTLRNYAVSGEVVLLTAGGGEVFYIGNNPEADGKYSPPPFVRATSGVEHEDFRTEAAARLGHPVTRREASSYWLGQGLRWISGHPLDEAILLSRKFLIFLNAYELPDNQNFYHHRLFVPLLRRLPTWALLLPLAAAGAALSLGAWRDILPLHVIALGYTASVMLFFNFARFRLPLVPILMVFAGEAIVEIPPLLARRRLTATTLAHLGAAAVALVVALLPPGNDALHVGQSEIQLADLLSKASRASEALESCEKGLSLLESIYTDGGGKLMAGGHGVAALPDLARPRLAVSFYGILMQGYEVRSRIARAQKDEEAALIWLGRAVEAAPDADLGFDALTGYGEALLDQGRVEESLAPLGRARGVEPNDLRLALLYAEALHRSGRPRDALQVVESTLDANPHPSPLDLADANYGLGLIYRDLGDVARMKFHFRETLSHNPRHPRAAWIRQVLDAEDSPVTR